MKLVINSNFGGFSLSQEAKEWLLRKGMSIDQICIGGINGAYVIGKIVTCLRSTKAKKKRENIYKEE